MRSKLPPSFLEKKNCLPHAQHCLQCPEDMELLLSSFLAISWGYGALVNKSSTRAPNAKDNESNAGGLLRTLQYVLLRE